MIIDGYAGAVPVDTIHRAARHRAPHCGETRAGTAPQCAYRAALEHLCPCIHNDECVCRAVAEEIQRVVRTPGGK